MRPKILTLTIGERMSIDGWDLLPECKKNCVRQKVSSSGAESNVASCGFFAKFISNLNKYDKTFICVKEQTTCKHKRI